MLQNLGLLQEKTIGDYVYNIAAVIGEGYSAKVYRGTVCFDPGVSKLTGEHVAVKVIELRHIDNEVEAMLLSNEINCHKILNHSNIVRILDQLQSRDRLYIISELCDGGNLYDYIVQHGMDTSLMQAAFPRRKLCRFFTKSPGQSTTSTPEGFSIEISSPVMCSSGAHKLNSPTLGSQTS